MTKNIQFRTGYNEPKLNLFELIGKAWEQVACEFMTKHTKNHSCGRCGRCAMCDAFQNEEVSRWCYAHMPLHKKLQFNFRRYLKRNHEKAEIIH